MLADLRSRLLDALPRCAPADPPLKDAADIVFVRTILGDTPQPEEANTLIRLCGEAQDPVDGAFPALHTFGMAIRALNMIGESPPVSCQFLDRWKHPVALANFVSSLDWNRPWKASIEVLHAATPNVLRWRDAGVDPAPFFQTLEIEQQENGGWGEDGFVAQMAAAFHFIPFYRAAGRTMPRLDQLASGTADLRFECIDFGAMDAAYVLEYALAGKAIPQARTEAFFEALRERLSATAPETVDRHGLLALAQTAGILARVAGDRSCRDGWAPELWRVER